LSADLFTACVVDFVLAVVFALSVEAVVAAAAVVAEADLAVLVVLVVLVVPAGLASFVLVDLVFDDFEDLAFFVVSTEEAKALALSESIANDNNNTNNFLILNNFSFNN
jgi:hypothetical protein